MCGIAGVIDFCGRPIAPDAIAAARDALAHRGPDDQGIRHFSADGFAVALAHTRLAVLDPSPAGHQPFADPTGRYQVVFNGEIYNFKDLQRELARHQAFRTRCDTETLLAAMIHRGPAGMQRFNGMWAFAFVDTVDRRGCLARDRFGVKPLYYAIGPNGNRAGAAARLMFASEMRAMLPLVADAGMPLEIDRQALYLYLSLGFVPHPLTIFRNVRKLPPGHVLEFDADGPRPPESYYRIARCESSSRLDYREAQDELRRRIGAAVAARTIADVPLGAFCSGGLDSSVVVAELARCGAGTVKTFSIGYADQPHYDETRFARLVAQRYGTEHRELRLTASDVLDAIPPLLNHMAEPLADSSLIPTSLVSRHTRQHVTVALSGDGGDELFGGYWRYLGHHYLRRYLRVPGPIRRAVIGPLLAAAPSGKTNRWVNRLRQARKLLRADSADPFDRHAAWSRLTEEEAVDGLFAERPFVDVAALLRRARTEIAPELAPADELTPLLLADLAFSLPADMLAKVDTASMFHALEVRVPMLDPAVVEFVAGLPIEFKIDRPRSDAQKRILRDAYRDILPAEVIGRAKMGFEVPIGEFLRNEMRSVYADVVRDDVLSDLGIRADAARAIWSDHETRRHERADILYALLALCWWRRKWSHAGVPV